MTLITLTPMSFALVEAPLKLLICYASLDSFPFYYLFTSLLKKNKTKVLEIILGVKSFEI